ncbi:hypothetical protein EC973_001497 [Apophysomyces ossiformis]|uniref:Uncharacterized protein n=1 Tax=Apophysomyces ossiformis TaxID=679940 RepID=A0A8H7BTM2_9FUNG|nr:hypothetical protein EC973_001497 [Apophysomyces ossiformis]
MSNNNNEPVETITDQSTAERTSAQGTDDPAEESDVENNDNNLESDVQDSKHMDYQGLERLARKICRSEEEMAKDLEKIHGMFSETQRPEDWWEMPDETKKIVGSLINQAKIEGERILQELQKVEKTLKIELLQSVEEQLKKIERSNNIRELLEKLSRSCRNRLDPKIETEKGPKGNSPMQLEVEEQVNLHLIKEEAKVIKKSRIWSVAVPLVAVATLPAIAVITMPATAIVVLPLIAKVAVKANTAILPARNLAFIALDYEREESSVGEPGITIHDENMEQASHTTTQKVEQQILESIDNQLQKLVKQFAEIFLLTTDTASKAAEYEVRLGSIEKTLRSCGLRLDQNERLIERVTELQSKQENIRRNERKRKLLMSYPGYYVPPALQH